MKELRDLVEDKLLSLEDEMLQLENEIWDRNHLLEIKKEQHMKLSKEHNELKGTNMEKLIREDEYFVIVECGDKYSFRRGWKKTLDRWKGIKFTLEKFEQVSENERLITDVRVIEGCGEIDG